MGFFLSKYKVFQNFLQVYMKKTQNISILERECSSKLEREREFQEWGGDVYMAPSTCIYREK